MGKKGTSKHCKVGDVLPTDYGTCKVVAINSHKSIEVVFENTGHHQTVSIHAITGNTLTDWSLFGCESMVKRMKEFRPDLDFSKFTANRTKDKSTVICKEHGDWEVSYEKIMSGRGCPKCRGYGKTTDEVVAKLKAVHGDTYDFSKVVYTKSTEKVEVVCRKHGRWFATVKTLLKGHGCRECFIERNTEQKRKSQEDFVKDATRVHGDKYDYSATKYVASAQKVQVRCIKHDSVFEQAASSHLGGVGCPLCGRESLTAAQAMPISEFKERAQKVHGDRYIYADACYSDDWPKVKIMCREHGTFTQSIHSHLLGSNCPVCRYETMGEKLAGGFDYYKSMMEERLGTTYKVLPFYGDKCIRETEVEVECLKCGKVLTRTVEAFVKPSGCECQRVYGGFSSDMEGFVYVLRSNRFVKIGVSKDVELRAQRLSQQSGENFTVAHKELANGAVCLRVEKAAHKVLRDIGYTSPMERFDGSTECFFDVDVNFCVGLVKSLIAKEQING